MTDRGTIFHVIESLFEDWIENNKNIHPLAVENMKQLEADTLAMLKEQDPVKPHYNARTNWYECGACHYSMTSGMHCRDELIPAYKVGYCAKCGRAVMWND